MLVIQNEKQMLPAATSIRVPARVTIHSYERGEFRELAQTGVRSGSKATRERADAAVGMDRSIHRS
jgi:hypothetical protein